MKNNLLNKINISPEMQLFLKRKSFLIVGATGLVGCSFVKVLRFLSDKYQLDISIYASGRSSEKLEALFLKDKIKWIVQDVTKPLQSNVSFNYIIDCASIADPKLYATFPVETILTNVQGLTELLKYAHKHESQVVFLSSVEVYGQQEEKYASLKENDFGYLDCNTLRACYPESKRCCETLCKAYYEEYKVKTYIARLCKTYGPYITSTDSKVMSYMLRQTAHHQNIILKSEGKQNLSFCHSFDVVIAILYILQNGNVAQAYNIANPNSTYPLHKIAEILTKIGNTKIQYELPTSIETKGFTTMKDAILDSSQISKLGFVPQIDMEDGLEDAVIFLKQKKEVNHNEFSRTI